MESWPERKARKLSWVRESDSKQSLEVPVEEKEERQSQPQRGERNTERSDSKLWPQRVNGERTKRRNANE